MLSIPISILMVSRWGSLGASLAMIPAYCLAGAGLLIILHRKLGVSTPAWLGRLASPRLLIPFGLAVVIAPLSDRWHPGTRTEAIASVALVGGGFSLLCTVALWWIGDARSLWNTARGWLLRMRPAGASGGAS